MARTGRPTANPRTEKLTLRLAKSELDDMQRCADALKQSRVEAIIKGISLLKKELNI